MARAILKEVAEELKYSYDYVRQVASGVHRNDAIENLIFQKKTEQLAELSASIKHEALTDFNQGQ